MNKAIATCVLILAGLSLSSAAAQGPTASATRSPAEKAASSKESHPPATVSSQFPAARKGEVEVTQKSSPGAISASSAFGSSPMQDAKTNDGALLAAAPRSTTAPAVSDESSLTTIYRVGIGDVLDVRLQSLPTSGSTLFTVLEGGVIDIPVIGGTMAVSGLTTDEIQTRLGAEFKRRALQDAAQITVGVRQYASHTVVVTGLVASGGTKILRREAVPLYVLLAETQSRLDAARATIARASTPILTIDLTDPASSSVLVRPGDVISITARPEQFYYIAGRINYPGQKAFQPGITLLQSILAAGGLNRQSDAVVELSREGTDGWLTTIRYSLKEIKSGKMRDPRLQPGDRIEVLR